MVTKINPPKIKSELIKIYENFIEDPEEKENRKKIWELSDYEPSVAFSLYDSATSKAIEYLGFLLQGGRHEYFTKKRVLREAKKILSDLKK